MDKLYAEGITSSNGVACMDFSFPNPTQDSYMEAVDQYSSSMRSELSISRSPSYKIHIPKMVETSVPSMGGYIIRAVREVLAKDLS